MLIVRILVGLVLALAGTYFVLRTSTIQDFFGPVSWAENKIGPGGTNLFYKLLGVLVILVGFIVMFNLWDAFLQATLGRLFPQQQA